jgi:hypothetical protein
MLTLFGKKKLTEDKLANVYVNSIMDMIDNGFGDVAGLINDDPDFVLPPNISAEDSDKFLLVVIVGNLAFLPEHFDSEQENRLKFAIIEKFSMVFGMDDEVFYKHVKEYSSFMSRVNHPSKNILYGMSKAVFHKYQLNDFQEKYFKEMNAPNPIFLKRLDDLMSHFIWDWNVFLEKYKIAR